MRLKIRQLSPALAVAALLLAVPIAGARADTTASLPQLTGFHQMVVDDLTSPGYVFLSAGASGTGALIVTDLAGSYVATVDAGDGVEGLALSPDGKTLYAALTAKQEVDAIDVSTITQPSPTETPYPLGNGEVPVDLAMESGELWVSYTTSSGGGAIGEIALSAPSPVFTPAALPQPSFSWYTAPQIAGDPQDKGVLVAATPGVSPTDAASYEVAGTSPTLLAHTSQLQSCSNMRDLAVVPGGTQFITACTTPAGTDNAYSTADLSLQPSAAYTTTLYQDAVAIAPDSTVAAGISSTPGPSIYVYSPGGASLLNTIQFAPSLMLAPRGLAWSSNGSTLYALTVGGGYSLNVYSNPTRHQSMLSLSGPSTAYAGDSITLSGSLSAAGAAKAGASVIVTRTAADGTAPAAQTATTLSDGSFEVTDSPPAIGTYTYSASYGGDLTTAPATASYNVTVSRIPSTLTLSTPGSVSIGKTYTINGTLALATGNPPGVSQVEITRTMPGTTAVHQTVQTSAAGAFSFSNNPPAAGTYTYTATYAETAATQAATATGRVTITKLPVSLRVTTNADSVSYDSTVRITVHLGPTHTNRTVAIYARTVGAKSSVLLKHGSVNSSGYLTASYRAPHSTVFSAVFTGDSRYRARTVTRTVGVLVKVAVKYTGYYISLHASGTTYHVFHRSGKLNTAISVTPNKHGQCVRLQTQEFFKGSWHASVTSGCGYLNKYSKIYGIWLLNNADLGYHYRTRIDYVRKSSDQSNLSTAGSWFYFIVRK